MIMELLLISGYTAVCITLFTLLRIPLNKWTVPGASIGGLVLIFALVQFLNYYHPYSGESRQYQAALTATAGAGGQVTAQPRSAAEHNLVAWFGQNSLFRLNDGSLAEVTFDSIPGKVFSGRVQLVGVTPVEGQTWSRDSGFDQSAAANESRVPVLVGITDPRYASYVSRIPRSSRAQTAVYGDQFVELALVRRTLLRMSAWMNYLSLFS
jgi:hypothetical protein